MGEIAYIPLWLGGKKEEYSYLASVSFWDI